MLSLSTRGAATPVDDGASETLAAPLVAEADLAVAEADRILATQLAPDSEGDATSPGSKDWPRTTPKATSGGVPEAERFGSVRDVRVRLKVETVVGIDLVAQTFTARLSLEASWLEEEMVGINLDEHPPMGDLDNYDALKMQRAA